MKIFYFLVLILICNACYAQSMEELQNKLSDIITSNEPTDGKALDYTIEFNECRMTIRAMDKADGSVVFIYRIPIDDISKLEFKDHMKDQFMMTFIAEQSESIYLFINGGQTFTNIATIILRKASEGAFNHNINMVFFDLKKKCVSSINEK